MKNIRWVLDRFNRAPSFVLENNYKTHGTLLFAHRLPRRRPFARDLEPGSTRLHA